MNLPSGVEDKIKTLEAKMKKRSAATETNMTGAQAPSPALSEANKENTEFRIQSKSFG